MSYMVAIRCSDTLTVPEGEQRADALIAAVPGRGRVAAAAAGTGCWPAGRSATQVAYQECFQQAKNEAGLDQYQVRFVPRPIIPVSMTATILLQIVTLLLGAGLGVLSGLLLESRKLAWPVLLSRVK